MEKCPGHEPHHLLHLELRFRITKAVTLLSIYAFVVQRGKALLFEINITFLLIG
jgi:hypothetical protein